MYKILLASELISPGCYYIFKRRGRGMVLLLPHLSPFIGFHTSPPAMSEKRKGRGGGFEYIIFHTCYLVSTPFLVPCPRRERRTMWDTLKSYRRNPIGRQNTPDVYAFVMIGHPFPLFPKKNFPPFPYYVCITLIPILIYHYKPHNRREYSESGEATWRA